MNHLSSKRLQTKAGNSEVNQAPVMNQAPSTMRAEVDQPALNEKSSNTRFLECKQALNGAPITLRFQKSKAASNYAPSIMRSQQGQATVELALSLVVLMFIIFAIVDFGRIFQTYLATNHATREGVRIASLGATDAEISTATKAAAQVDDVNQLTVTITPPKELRKRGTFVTVATTYPVTISVPLMEMLLPNPFTVKSKTVMRVE